LLALSDFAQHFFLIQNRGLIDESVMKDKLTVFYGAVEAQTKRLQRRLEILPDPTKELRVCMVGHDFFQKGGIALLRAFRRLHEAIPHCRLVIVSKIAANDFVTHTPNQEADRVRGYLAGHEAIEWYPQLPHNEVLDVMTGCHIGLLPTLDDTLGWSVLEAMSVGCAVLTTNVCALPEMVHHGENGCLINLPLSENRRWAGLSFPEHSRERQLAVEEGYDLLADGLVRQITQMANRPAELHRMSAKAIEYVDRVHSPAKRAQSLSRLYWEALAN